MVDAKKLLDVFLGAAAQIGQPVQQQGGQAPATAPGVAAGGAGQPAPVGLPPKINETVQQVTGQTPDQLLQKAKTVMEQHPGLVQAAAIGLAGLLFGRRKAGRGVPGSLVKLGGLAVIGGLAYKAFQNSQAGKTLLQGTPAAAGPGGASPPPPAALAGAGAGTSPAGAAGAPAVAAGSARARAGQAAPAEPVSLEVPTGSQFHPVSHTEDDALLFLRAMVAAAAADGQIDEAERSRIIKGLTEAGIDPEATRWLEREMAAPADVEELAAGIESPEKAAQVYAAARIAVDPDTLQEREFLRQLAAALDLDEEVRSQIDSTAGALKFGTA